MFHLFRTFQIHKRIVLSILLLLFLFFPLEAQHLKFLDIPINGSISEFQIKLKSKGIIINKQLSSEAPNGQRVFNGKFQGYDSKVVVYYNRKNMNVYKVEVTVHSNKLRIIQNLVANSVQKIENKYCYIANHNLEDESAPHYLYDIYPNSKKGDAIGVIHIKPSSAYLIEDSNLLPSGYMIRFIYEDAVNTNALTPSTQEPHSPWGFSCGEPDYFYKWLSWANNYRKNDCYEKSIFYLMWTLDYYKYGCVPEQYLERENEIEEAIEYFQSCKIGTIKTAYHNEYSNVYRICDENTGRFKCIEFSVNSDMIQVKLDTEDIKKQISSLTQLRQAYLRRKSAIGNSIFDLIDDNLHEDISITLPALIGEEKFGGGFGNIEWNHTELTSKFVAWHQELRIEISYNKGFSNSIFLFRNDKEIEDYLNILKSVNIH